MVRISDYPLCVAAEARIARLPKVPNVRPEDLAAVVRLLLRAKLQADTKGLPLFFLSNLDIARRLNCGESTASRFIQKPCRTHGLLAAVCGKSWMKRGEARMSGRQREMAGGLARLANAVNQLLNLFRGQAESLKKLRILLVQAGVQAVKRGVGAVRNAVGEARERGWLGFGRQHGMVVKGDGFRDGGRQVPHVQEAAPDLGVVGLEHRPLGLKCGCPPGDPLPNRQQGLRVQELADHYLPDVVKQGGGEGRRAVRADVRALGERELGG